MQRQKNKKINISFCGFLSFLRRSDAGFTLVEIVVVASIMIMISSVALYNFRSGKSSSQLISAAQKFALDVRKAQNLAASAIIFNNQIPFGYGIYVFSEGSTSYTIFADLNDNKIYDVGEEYETVNLETPMQIFSMVSNPLGTVFPLNIFFIAPSLKGIINNNILYDSVSVIIKFGSVGEVKTIDINNFGYVNVR